MNDANMSVVLPTKNADSFMELFAPHNTEGFNVQECEETDRYDNAHGVSLRVVNFQPNFDLYDMIYGVYTREHSFRAVCERFGVKRLIAHKMESDSGDEESVTYDNITGVQYNCREAYPSPDDEFLDDKETIEEAEAEAE